MGKPVDVEKFIQEIRGDKWYTYEIIEKVQALATELKTVHESWQQLNRLYQGTCGLLRKAEAELKEAQALANFATVSNEIWKERAEKAEAEWDEFVAAYNKTMLEVQDKKPTDDKD